MQQRGPNGRSVVGTRTVGMNGHGIATSVHADQGRSARRSPR